MANKNLAGKTVLIPVATERESSGITSTNCVQLDNSPASFGGNQSGGMGQDAECNTFERFLQRSLDEVLRFNEQLANEQTNKGQSSTSR
jgi:hypothetical protein